MVENIEKSNQPLFWFKLIVNIIHTLKVTSSKLPKRVGLGTDSLVLAVVSYWQCDLLEVVMH